MKKFAFSLLALSLLSTAPAYAVSICSLGQTCLLSAHIQISPMAGSTYFRCYVDPQGSKLKLWTHSGSNFMFTEVISEDTKVNGMSYGRPYNVFIKGMFLHHNNAEMGEIRFRKLWGHGTVTCYPYPY